MPLVQLGEVQEWIAQEIPDSLVASVERYIRSGHRKLTAYLGRTLESGRHDDTVEVADPNPWAELYVNLPHTPVTAVESVSVNGSALAADAWRMERSGILLLTRPAVVSPSAPVGRVTVQVVYTGGYPAGHPAANAAADAILSRAGRLAMKAMDAAVGARGAQVEGYSVQYDKEGFTDDELLELKRYRRRIVTSPPTLPGTERA